MIDTRLGVSGEYRFSASIIRIRHTDVHAAVPYFTHAYKDTVQASPWPSYLANPTSLISSLKQPCSWASLWRLLSLAYTDLATGSNCRQRRFQQRLATTGTGSNWSVAENGRCTRPLPTVAPSSSELPMFYSSNGVASSCLQSLSMYAYGSLFLACDWSREGITWSRSKMAASTNTLSVLEWSEEAEDSLVRLWQERPCLYDTTCKTYSNRQKKRSALVEMSTQLEIPGMYSTD